MLYRISNGDHHCVVKSELDNYSQQFTVRRIRSRRCRQCTKRNLLRDVPGRASPWSRSSAESRCSRRRTEHPLAADGFACGWGSRIGQRSDQRARGISSYPDLRCAPLVPSPRSRERDRDFLRIFSPSVRRFSNGCSSLYWNFIVTQLTQINK